MAPQQPFERLLNAAKEASLSGEVPVAAAIYRGQECLALATNQVETTPDPTAHAEILAIREAAITLGSPRLVGCTLYVTLEPCAMCAQAIAHARIERLIFGAYDPKGGAVEHGIRLFQQPTCHHHPDIIGGVNEAACSALLKDFFASKR